MNVNCDGISTDCGHFDSYAQLICDERGRNSKVNDSFNAMKLLGLGKLR